MAVSFTNIAGSGSAGFSATSYTTGTLTLSGNTVYFLWLASQVASGTPNVPTITNNTVSWTQEVTYVAGVIRLTLFKGWTTGTPTTTTETVSFGGQTQTGYIYKLAAASGTAIGNNGGDAFGQNNNALVTASLSMNTALTSPAANHGIIFGALTQNTFTGPLTSSGYTNLNSVVVSGGGTLWSQWKNSGSTPVPASWTNSSNAIMIAVEVATPFSTSEPFSFDGSADLTISQPKIVHSSEAITLDGTADLTTDLFHDILNVSPEKIYEYKIFDSGGTYLTSLKDVISDYGYTQDINTSGNGIQIELGRTADYLAATLHNLITESTSENIDTEASDDIQAVTSTGAQIGAGSNIDLNYGIEVWVYYGYEDILVDENGTVVADDTGVPISAVVGSPHGLRLFSGFISGYAARYGQNETTLLTCLPYTADLDQYVVKNGTSTTAAYNTYDPSAILRGVLDSFVSQGGLVTYDTSSIADTATVVSYTFKLKTTLEAIKQCLILAPTNWWWRGDVSNNKIVFKPLPTTTTHTFVQGKHIKSVELLHNIEGVTNDYYFMGGDQNNDVTNPSYLFKHYTDSTSQTAYRRHLQRDTDQRVISTDSADIIGNSLIATKKDPRYTGSITVLTDVYDIETIELGQLVGFQNFGNFVDNLQLQVVHLAYGPDSVTLNLDSLVPQPSKRLEDIKRNLLQVETQNIPDTPS